MFLARTMTATALTLTALLTGCGGATTETGYTPHRLGMSGPEVRALYAPAFSPEAQAQKTDQTPVTRKPGGI